MLAKALFYLALPTGFEPETCPLGGGCAIQLRYGSEEEKGSVPKNTSHRLHLFMHDIADLNAVGEFRLINGQLSFMFVNS